MVLKLLPIWSTCILFWIVYSQMTNFSVEQATYMNRPIGSFVRPPFRLPFLLPLRFHPPLHLPQREIPRSPRPELHPQTKSKASQAFSGPAKRRNLSVHHDTKMSVFWLVLQFFLVGAGVAFAYVGQFEFFIREAPERMKPTSTGLFLSTLSMGFFFSSSVVAPVDQASNGLWIKNNLTKGRLTVLSVIKLRGVSGVRKPPRVQSAELHLEQAR
ncbi:unnamed protein product [Musa hybrid cultivar]